MDDTIRSALVTLIYSRRKHMSRAARKRPIKPQRWLYPHATENRFAASYRAWLRPMKTYVHSFLKQNQAAILHGDSAGFRADSIDDISVTRLDAVPGRTFRVMVDSLEGWLAQYVPDDDASKTGSPIFMGLSNMADSVFNFNDTQYEKGAKSALGVEFPVGESWWPDARENWAQTNYQIVSGDMRKYLRDINAAVERAVTTGRTARELSATIQSIDKQLTKSRAKFIARDQIGKLNGEITQRRMESIGLSMYIWETAGDEGVRGNPSGKYPDAHPSHYVMDGRLCRWDDSSVYSEDGGKTWKDRGSDAVDLHPGQDYQCRCTATAYWDELVGEADAQIDLLTENQHNIPEGSRVMEPLKAESNNMSVQEKQQAEAAERQAKNEAANTAVANNKFSNETWQNADAIKNEFVEVPKGASGIMVATSKLPVNMQEGLEFLKEITSAMVLKSKGASVTLIPRIRRLDGKGFLPGPDAIVNGSLYEFKTVTGKIKKVGRRFIESREQGNNVYIRVDNPRHTRAGVIKTLSGIINNSDYTGGFKGNVVFTVGEGHGQKTYFFRIKDLKK